MEAVISRIEDRLEETAEAVSRLEEKTTMTESDVCIHHELCDDYVTHAAFELLEDKLEKHRYNNILRMESQSIDVAELDKKSNQTEATLKDLIWQVHYIRLNFQKLKKALYKNQQIELAIETDPYGPWEWICMIVQSIIFVYVMYCCNQISRFI